MSSQNKHDAGKFVLLAMARTGSNMLVTALNNHPDIRCYGELFSLRDIEVETELFQVFRLIDPVFMSKDYRYEFPHKLIDAFIGISKEKLFGFKLMLNQNPDLIDKIVNDSNWKIILLDRENELACYSSLLIARSTGQGIARHYDEVKTAKVVFDEQEFSTFKKQRSRRYEQVRQLLEQRDGEFLSISYLSLVTGNGYNDILKFLGANESIGPNSDKNTKKRNPSDILGRFINQADVQNYLRREGLEGWTLEQLPESKTKFA